MPPRRPPVSDGTERTTPTASRMAASAASPVSTSASAMQPFTGRRYDESWVEIASQPSSSSVSSIADEIIVTGLRVGSGAIGPDGAIIPQRRRRLLQQVEAAAAGTRAATAAQPSASTASPFLRSSAGSSQDEYDETESEEDQAMPGSVGAPVGPRPFAVLSAMPQGQPPVQMQHRATASDGDDEEEEEEDDDDDNVTALGMPSSGPPVFRPQPNAFTHPPSLIQQQQQQQQQQQPQQQHRSMPTPPHQHLASQFSGNAVPQRVAQARASRAYGAPYLMAPSYREDHDAALRASLTTLLSCAAAARGLSKREGESYGEPSSAATTGIRPSNQPLGLRLAPESELMAEAPVTHAHPSMFHQQQSRATNASGRQPTARADAAAGAAAGSATQRHISRGSTGSAVSTSSKSKRTAAAASGAGAASRSSPRATKKKRTSVSAAVGAEGDATATFVSPTLLTWVVSAGVVVLVSVVGFGAGFVIGREVGRQEAASAALSSSGNCGLGGSTGVGAVGNAPAACGHEIMRSSTGSSLRRFRWGTGMTKSVMA